MSVTKLQATQTVLHDVLSEVNNAVDEQLDSILGKINTSLKVPGLLSLGSGLVVNIGNTTLTKPNGTKIRLVLGDVDIGGLSGSMDFSNGTTVTGDVQVTSLPTLTANQWYKAGFEIRVDKKIYVVWGTIGSNESLAGFPDWSNVSIALGYVALQVNGTGTAFLTPTSGSINQVGGTGSGGEQLSDHTLLTNRDSANQHPTTALATTTGEFTGDCELSATEDEVQKSLVRLSKFDSIFNWASGKSYRVGNVVKAIGTTYGTTLYRCIVAHTAGTFDIDFSTSKWELFISAQNHNTLANKNAVSQHPTTSIDTVTGDFAMALSPTESTAQLAFVRLEQFNSCFDWITAKLYRVGNIVKTNGTIYRCISEHTAGTFATDLSGGKWELTVSAQDHQTLANRTATAAHPATSIASTTTGFTDFLRTSDDELQKIIDRVDDYTSIRAYNASNVYRINNTVINNGTLWRCTTDGASGTFNETDWTLVLNAPSEEVQNVSASGGQSVFTLGSITVPTATTKLWVFVNGVYQINPTHYGVTNPTTITFTSTLPQNAQVVFRLS